MRKKLRREFYLMRRSLACFESPPPPPAEPSFFFFGLDDAIFLDVFNFKTDEGKGVHFQDGSLRWMRILSSHSSIDDSRQGWHRVSSVPCNFLAQVVDHCKPANSAFLTLVLSNLVFIREGVIFAPCMPSILRRKIEKARCRKFKAKRNRNLN